jgi:ammonium transporter Rh
LQKSQCNSIQSTITATGFPKLQLLDVFAGAAVCSITLHLWTVIWTVIQLLLLSFSSQVPLYALNQHLCFQTLQALDMGGSITIHAFGAYYGLAASLVLSNKRQAFGAYTSANPKNSASYISDLFSIIGTLFLWMFVSAIRCCCCCCLPPDETPEFYLLSLELFSIIGTLFLWMFVSAVPTAASLYTIVGTCCGVVAICMPVVVL